MGNVTFLNKSGRGQAILNLENCISSMHAANKTVTSAYGTSLGLVESTIMAEVLGADVVSPSVLAKELLLSPVAVVRTLDRMTAAGQLERKASTQDKRKVTLQLTAAGRREFFEAHKLAADTFAAALARVPADDQERFAALMDAFADGLGAPQATRLKNDPAVMNAVRRITRSLGFLSPYTYNFKELDPLAWHVLRKLEQASKPGLTILARDLSRDLGVKPNTMSVALKRMEQRGLIARRATPDNKRERPLSCTAQGLALAEGCRTAARALISNGVKNFSNEELDFFARAWLHFANCAPATQNSDLGEGFQFSAELSHELRRKARKVVLEWRLKSGLTEDLPGILLGEQSAVFLAHKGGEVSAVVEIYENEVLHACLREENLPGAVVRNFIAAVKQEIAMAAGGKSLRLMVPPGNCSPKLYQLAWG